MAGAQTKPQAFIWNFCFGLLFGGCITYVVVKFSGIENYIVTKHYDYERKALSNSNLFDPYGHVEVDRTNRVSANELKQFEKHHDHTFLGQDAVANTLYNKVRILCWVMTGPQNIDSKAVHVYATWGKRCNKIVFISSQLSEKVPVVKIDTQEGRNYLWQKTRAAFQYIYDNLLDDYDWFLKADDDTFVVVENLRYFLSTYNPDLPIYFGHKFKPYVKQGYMSGGGGYVVNRIGVKRLVEKAFSDSKKCHAKTFVGGAEDVEIGKCFQNAGVPAGDSRDSEGRNRFHPFSPEAHLNPDGLPKKFWYWDYLFYPPKEGLEGCCADYSVTFHYVSPGGLYNLEYMVYHMRPFGIGTYTCPADLSETILKLASRNEAPPKEEKAPNEVEKSDKEDTRETEAKDTVDEQQPVEKKQVEGQQNR